MAHINELVDFTVTAYIVYRNKVLLIDHKELKKWLPVGGHIELDEDPDLALIREVKEESGLDVTVLAEIPPVSQKNTKFLFRPEGVTVHDITKTHKHIDLIYFCKTSSSKVTLAEGEHNDIKWFSKKELDDTIYNLRPSVKYYAKMALNRAKPQESGVKKIT